MAPPATPAPGGGRPPLLLRIGPGMLVAATGVGAGDLATGAFTGSVLGTAVLWAVLVGAALKFVLSEGLARWQLVTGESLLAGVLHRTPRAAHALFLAYLLLWSWFLGSALIGACGVTTHALFPVLESAETGKVAYGILQSLVGLLLVRCGGFRLFERMMGVCIGLMFVTVVVTAALLRPDPGEILRGLLVPSIPAAGGQGLSWTLALIGGVGGTLTLLSYGYWIRETGRVDASALGACRLDLGLGFGMTALFGLAMVVIGSTIEVEGRGSGLIVTLAERLEEPLGPVGRLVFLLGAWGAVFSSLLGVWQSVPFLFADGWRILRGTRGGNGGLDTIEKSRAYRRYQVALALVPVLGLAFSFREVQKAYAVIGAFFLPGLALALLLLNRRRLLGEEHANRALTVGVLAACLAFFAAAGAMELWARWTG